MSKCLFCKSDEGPLLRISGDVCHYCVGCANDNATLRSRVEALEGVVRELVDNGDDLSTHVDTSRFIWIDEEIERAGRWIKEMQARIIDRNG